MIRDLPNAHAYRAVQLMMALLGAIYAVRAAQTVWETVSRFRTKHA